MNDKKELFHLFLRRLPGLLTVFALSGCAAVGTDYIRPEVAVPDRWATATAGSSADDVSFGEWWKNFHDPLLTELIGKAVQGNLDYKKAEAHLREARSRREVAKAPLVPSLDASASASWSRRSEGADTELYSSALDASWEADIFGGVRRSVEASQADLEAAQEDLRDILVSLVAEVAINYVDCRTYQERLSVAEENINTQQETFLLTQWRYQAGLDDELAVQQARFNLENSRSQLPALRTGLHEAANRISVLLGEHPGRVKEELMPVRAFPEPPLEVATGLPADLLRRRPDIRRAERELAAQTARVGEAEADLYPRLSLSGSIGLEALSPEKLLTSAVKVVTGGLGISLPVFRGGEIRQNIAIQSALQEQTLIQYEAAVLSALEEVENSLVACAEEEVRQKALTEAVAAALKAAELAQQQYEAGLTDFTVVLDAQRSLFSFQDELVVSKAARVSNLIKLYKALGGGWETLASQENGH